MYTLGLGCVCCEGKSGPPPPPECNIYGDAFERPNSTDLGPNWEEVAGDQEILNNRLRLPLSAELAVAVPASVDPKYKIYSNSLNVEFSGTDDRFRQIVGYQDAQNYLFVEVRRWDDFGTINWTLALWERVGGADNLLSPVLPAYQAPNTLADVEVCYDEDTGLLTGYLVIAGLLVIIDHEPATAPGTRAGVGTGATTAPIDVDSFNYQYQGSATRPGCPECPVPCPTCDNGEAPIALALDLTGIDTGGPCGTAGCGNLAQVYIVPYNGQFENDCNWFLEVPNSIRITVNLEPTLIMTVSIVLLGTDCVGVGLFDDSSYRLTGLPSDCLNWDLSLPKEVATSNPCFPDNLPIAAV